jgi:predicted lipoprotein with Yx(FWY)xxD motif
MVKSGKAGGATVLTNSQGMTLYWFAIDTSTKSNCTSGTCVHFWHPVKGPVTVASGINGKVGTIKRADGSVQATYDGHPLYTFLEDHSPGQATGNGKNLDGGVWHEVTVSGSSSGGGSGGGGGGGGGYGY